MLSVQPIHYSLPIFEDNVWNKYKYIFATLLSEQDFSKISQFYEVAEAIKTQQIAIKQKIYEHIFAKTINYYNQQFLRINACISDENSNKEDRCRADLDYCLSLYNKMPVDLYLHKEFGDGLIKGLNRYYRLSGTSTFEQLVKKSKIRLKNLFR